MPSVHHFVSLPMDLHEELRAIAQLRGVSLSDVLIESLVLHLEEHRECLWKNASAPAWIGYAPKALAA